MMMMMEGTVMTMTDELSLQEKYDIITRNLEEVASCEELRSLLELKPDPVIYWGTAITGKPHMGYFVPILKISDFLKAGCKVKILFADLHGFLDNQKSEWELLKNRCKYYELLIKEMLVVIGVPIERLEFVRGTDYQLSSQYTLDMYKITALITTEHSTHAGSQVVKQVKNPLMSSLLYPILQVLDEQYLNVDIQFGGVDQRKIFMFARELLPKIGYRKRIHLMNPLIPGLGKSGKMSSSEPNSKIDFDDCDETIRKKIMQAYIVDGVVENNGLLSLLKYVLFNIIKAQGRKFIVHRDEKWGGNCEFSNYEQVERAFRDSELVSIDLKNSVYEELVMLITPIRDFLKKNEKILEFAYPLVKEEGRNVEASNTGEATIASLDIRIGKIVNLQKHPLDESFCIIKVDVGEEEPRTIVSELIRHISTESLSNRLLLVICNIAFRSIRGIENQGAILTAYTKEKPERVELIEIPSDCQVGEKLHFPLDQHADERLTAKRLNRILKSTFTDEKGVPYFKRGDKEYRFCTRMGECTSILKNALVK